jgi:TonB family protein
MHPAIAYLLKMLLCSAVLLGYYWAALRNERFHQWNRFYLLAAFVLSLLVPLLRLPLASQQPTPVVDMVAALPWNQVIVVRRAAPGWGAKETGLLLAAVVSLFLLLQLLLSVLKVVRLYRRSSPSVYHEVSVVVTDERSAPFSFFRWLFWRSDIDPDSPGGQRMLQHELTHVSEKHSADKLLVELIMVAGWINPFFWIMRRELYAIHEFLADQKAIARYDGAAFADMILQAANALPVPTLANPLFSSHLKRRLKMITTSYQPKYSYLRRISGLVLMVATALLLIITIEQAQAQPNKQATPPPPPAPHLWTVPPDSIKSAEVMVKKGVRYVKFEMKDGRKLQFELDEALQKGYLVPPSPPLPPAAPNAIPGPPAAPPPSSITIHEFSVSTGARAPLYIYAGLQITEEQMRQIAPDQIASIEVLKGESAKAMYGERGANGVVVITPKTSATPSSPAADKVSTTGNGPGEVGMAGYTKPATEPQKNVIEQPAAKAAQNGGKPLVVMDGKVVAQEALQSMRNMLGQIDQLTVIIDQATVLTGEEAIQRYGAAGANGVIELTTKEGPPAPAPATSFTKVFTKVEQMPAFPGGRAAWLRHLERTLQYPAQAQEKGTQGAVQVQFIVDLEGNLSDIKALNDPGDGLAQEAVRIIKTGPRWEPAVQNGRKVVARTVQTITFKLE